MTPPVTPAATPAPAAVSPAMFDAALARIAALEETIELLQMQVIVHREDTERDIDGLSAAVHQVIRRTRP